MKPVMQTQFYPGPGRKDTGNCFAACVASILELDIEDVPNFAALEDPEDSDTSAWWSLFCDFVLERGLSPIYWEAPENKPSRGWKPPEIPGYTILTGLSPRGVQHSVIGLDGEIVHDPHPSNLGIKVEEMIAFLAVDPAKMVTANKSLCEFCGHHNHSSGQHSSWLNDMVQEELARRVSSS